MSNLAKPSEKSICGVCGKPITGNDAFAYSHPDTDAKWRHKKCGPGSKQWTAKHGKSKIGALLEKKSARPRTVSTKQDPLHQAIKEFCGRIKYMVFMDSMNKTKIEWEVYSQTLGIKHTSAEPPPDPEVLYKQLSGPTTKVN